jgi:hypothetical protein
LSDLQEIHRGQRQAERIADCGEGSHLLWRKAELTFAGYSHNLHLWAKPERNKIFLDQPIRVM